MTTKIDHLAIRNIDEGHLFVCDHCGAAQIVRLPIALSDWLTASRRFMKAHRHCRPQTVQPAAVAREEHLLAGEDTTGVAELRASIARMDANAAADPHLLLGHGETNE